MSYFNYYYFYDYCKNMNISLTMHLIIIYPLCHDNWPFKNHRKESALLQPQILSSILQASRYCLLTAK